MWALISTLYDYHQRGMQFPNCSHRTLLPCPYMLGAAEEGITNEILLHCSLIFTASYFSVFDVDEMLWARIPRSRV